MLVITSFLKWNYMGVLDGAYHTNERSEVSKMGKVL